MVYHRKPHITVTSKCPSIGYGSAGVHYYFFNELKICLLVQKAREGSPSDKLGVNYLYTP